jgi:cardiolipin synthase
MAMPALLPGHQLQLLQGGVELFAAMIESIALARHEVLLETYIFDFVGAGSQVAAALVQAAGRGVTVRLMVDGVGTPHVPAEWRQRFDGAGVQWHLFAPLGRFGLLLPSRWRRLHRKLCVVDGRTAFCGGINVLDDFHDPQYGALEAPRFDFAVRVHGPLVRAAHDVVSQLWWRTQALRKMRDRELAAAWESARRAGKLRYPDVDPDTDMSADKGQARAALVLRDNIQNRRTIERSYLKAIGAAHHDIVIANAYFLPGGKLRRALIHAARRGVQVRVLLQGRYEYFMAYHAARPVYGSLLAAGIELHEYAPSFLHAKVAVIDADGRQPWATVGSSNLDPLSLLLAREANVMAVDAQFAQGLKARLETAMTSHGRRMDPTLYAQRRWSSRALDWLAYGLMRFALAVTGKRY